MKYYKIYKVHKFKQARVRRTRVARWGTWLVGKGKNVRFETVFEKPMDGNSLMFCGIEFQIIGAANQKLCEQWPWR